CAATLGFLVSSAPSRSRRNSSIRARIVAKSSAARGLSMSPPGNLVEFWLRRITHGLARDERNLVSFPGRQVESLVWCKRKGLQVSAATGAYSDLPELRNHRLASFSDWTRRRCSVIHASASASVENGLTL